VIVLDASVVVELLMNGDMAAMIREELSKNDELFLVPHLIDVEVVSAIRRMALAQRLDKHRIQEYLEDLALLPAERYSPTPLLGRIWERRHNFTAYDATYIALAEATNSVLYTCDGKLRVGHRARVVVFTS
jgi:predicted nucleic acid-binding protein